MALQWILVSAEQGDEAQVGPKAMIAVALRRAFPRPAEDAEGRFQDLPETLSRREQTGDDQHARGGHGVPGP
jgi:hypothetical protein